MVVSKAGRGSVMFETVHYLALFHLKGGRRSMMDIFCPLYMNIQIDSEQAKQKNPVLKNFISDLKGTYVKAKGDIWSLSTIKLFFAPMDLEPVSLSTCCSSNEFQQFSKVFKVD